MADKMGHDGGNKGGERQNAAPRETDQRRPGNERTGETQTRDQKEPSEKREPAPK